MACETLVKNSIVGLLIKYAYKLVAHNNLSLKKNK